MHCRFACRPCGCALLTITRRRCAGRQTAAWAGSGPLFSLPQVGVKNKSGLIISLDGRGVEGNGYRPVRVEVTPWPPKPLTADRQIRIVIKPNSYNASSTPQVSQVIDLPEGSTQVEAILSVPQSALWYSMSIETYEGGEKLEDLSHPHMGWANVNYWDWTEDRPTMLFIDPQVPARSAARSGRRFFQGDQRRPERRRTTCPTCGRWRTCFPIRIAEWWPAAPLPRPAWCWRQRPSPPT